MAAQRRRDDKGATAVMFALLALVLLGVGALAIDMGQAYAKRAALQSNVDMAALAAAAELDGSDTCTHAAIDAAEDYLTKATNEVHGQISLDLDSPVSWTPPAPLPGPDTVPAPDEDGKIVCEGWNVRLWAPKATVDYGLAKALPGLSDTGVNVPAYAAASVGSPDSGVMPAYAVSGCDYGPQTLIDDSSPGPVPTPPLPGGATDTTNPGLTTTSVTPMEIPLSGVSSIVVSGSQTSSATHIGFSTPSSDTNLHYEYPVSSTTNGTATLDQIPSAVTTIEDVWYVRLSRDSGNTWSNAQRLLVGNAQLQCASAPSDGNFGALTFYRDPDPNVNDRLALNMAMGLDFSLSTFPTPAPNWLCTDGVDGAIESTGPSDLNDGTNCVDTDTGLPAQATEKGLITGVSGEEGRLVEPPHPSCARPLHHIEFGGSVGAFDINDDILTCFFTGGTTQIDDIGAGYNGPPVISEEIFESPRFLWVPVLGTEPSGGGDRYQIVDFRPGFIGDQASSASKGNPQVVEESLNHNGIGLKDLGGSKYTLRSLNVIFFDVDALPDSVQTSGPTVPYLGVGPKILSLTE